MKKVFILAVAAFLFTGAIAQDEKKCNKEKKCCKKECPSKKEVVKKDKTTTATVLSKKA